MSAPVGNTNALGNRGNKAGRKSQYQERADAGMLWYLFTSDIDKAELVRRIQSGKHSVQDVFIFKALNGSEHLIVAMFNKLFPNNMTMTANVNQKQMSALEESVRHLLETASGDKKKTHVVGSDLNRLAQNIKITADAIVRV